VVCIAFYAIVAIMVVLWLLGLTPTAPMRQYFWPLAGFVYFLAAIQDLWYRIDRSRVDNRDHLTSEVEFLSLPATASKSRQNGNCRPNCRSLTLFTGGDDHP
jgi:hypothetical protein